MHALLGQLAPSIRLLAGIACHAGPPILCRGGFVLELRATVARGRRRNRATLFGRRTVDLEIRTTFRETRDIVHGLRRGIRQQPFRSIAAAVFGAMELWMLSDDRSLPELARLCRTALESLESGIADWT